MDTPKYRADVAGINEATWSNNAMEYDTPEEVKEWLKGLSSRWFGYDMARVVSTNTPKGEAIDKNDESIFQNFRRS